MAGLLRRLTGRGAPPAAEAPPGTLELRGNGTRVVLVPALGARLTTLELGGREWLRPGGALVERFPGDAEADADDAAARRAEVHVETTPEGNVAVAVWRGERAPWRLERRLRVAPGGTIEARYAAVNEGTSPLPCRWTVEALLPLTATTRIVVAEGTPLRVAEAQRLALGAAGVEHRWPHARLEKSIADFSRPARVARRYAARLLLQPKDGRIAIEEGGVALELAVDPSEVPGLALRLNHRGAPIGAERAPDALVLSASTEAPDTETNARRARAASALAPGERREWTATWSARAAAPAGR